MCGILYNHNLLGKPVNNDILQQFDKQRARGTQGFGLFDGEFMHMVKSASEDKILNWLCKYDSSLILFHHRFPTSTVNVKRAAHPISTKAYFDSKAGKTQYVMVHNGVIRNANDLFGDHQERGIDYITLLDDLTFNDSESLLWDFALTMEGKQPKMKAIGDMAFICLKIVNGKLDKMYFGRKGRPLMLYRDQESFELSSEGRGISIPEDQLHTYGYKTKRLTLKYMNFTQYKPFVSNYTPQPACATYGNDEEYERWKNGDKNPETTPHLIGQGAPPVTIEDVKRVPNSAPTWLGDTLKAKYDKLFPKREDIILPSESEIENTALGYIIQAQGLFEDAYWLAEDSYTDFLHAVDNVANIRQRMLLEGVMEYIQLDPEYKRPNSVSSVWRALCDQQSLVTV